MQNRSLSSAVRESLPFFGQRLSAAASLSSRRLLAAAALLHIGLAVGLFWAGRAQVAPSLIDRDGIMGFFAFDSYEYQHGAVRLAEVLRQGGVGAWAAESAPVHVKLISIQFALLEPLFGYSTLSAEPVNLLCYLAVVGLTLALGREVGGRRVGLLAAGFVALWPTFLLHTLQLLKDSLFIAGALVLVLCVTTWLTRTYDARGAIVMGALTGVAISLLLLIRVNFAVVVFMLALFGFALLVVRQTVERRPLYWNMLCPLLILGAGLLLLPLHSTRGGQKFKHYPSDGSGQPKAVASAGVQVSTNVSYLPRIDRESAASPTSTGRVYAAADRVALRVGSVRYRFSAFYRESGSNIDPDARIIDIRSLFHHLPRAFQIGCCAPFPSTWVASGKLIGSAGKLLSGAETLVIYVFELLALVAVLRPPRRLAACLLLSITAFGVTSLGLVIPNIGALYRFRYTFWVLLIILGAKGLEAILTPARRRLGAHWNGNRVAAGVTLCCLLATACACSSQAGVTGGEAVGGGGAQEEAARETTSVREGVTGGRLGFAIVNFTGSSFRAVYISPSDSTGWEENVLGASRFEDGDTIDIRFNPEESAVLWDIRVEAVDKHYAEWKGLNLRDASRITLLLKPDVESAVVVAEVE
ncbi:MAG: hypothetical protein LC803_18585 [Acidobacteria bacterium]|nr:hypothetical protein [Acidobacteriota bacterium]